MQNAAVLTVSFLVAIETLVAATEQTTPGTPISPSAIRRVRENTVISEDRQGSISIVAARWGAYNGWVDVTERVKVFVRDGRMVIPHVPDSLGQLRDPAFGHHKALVVVYRQGQETRLAIVPSQGRLDLPEPASGATGRRPDVNVVDSSDIQAATSLVGITRDDRDHIGLVKVDLATGKATPVLRMAVGKFECYSLTYHGPSGRFLTADVRSPAMGIFDPQLEAFTKVAIVGLPAGQEKISGITYQLNKDRILVSFGPSGGNHENRIAQINLEGHVLKISADTGLGDRDFLGWHPLSGGLLAIDFNGRSPRIATVVDPFGTLSTIRFGDPPRDRQLTGLAVLSPHGRMFTVRQDSRELVEIIDGGKQFSTIGSFRTTADVIGITAAPNDWMARPLGKRPPAAPLKPAANSLKRPVFESVLGVYGQAIRGQRFPFVNLRPPDRNLWTKEIENKLRGTLSYAEVDYIGTAKLVIPETGTYTIDLPERGTQLRLNGIVVKVGDIKLQKGVYDVEIYTNHWGQPYLKYAHANVFKNGTRTKVPFVNTDAAIEDFHSQKIDSRKVIEVCDYNVKRVRVVNRELGSMLRFAGSGYVVVPELRYDGSYPITLEAIVQAPCRGTIVGSFDGSGLGLDTIDGHCLFHVNDGRSNNGGYATIKSHASTPGDKPVHIAGVFDGRRLSLFVDGKLQGSDKIIEHKVSSQPFIVGADPDSRGEPQQFLAGTIGEVHISRIARYEKDFTPPGRHEPDRHTLILFRFEGGRRRRCRRCFRQCPARENPRGSLGQVRREKELKVTIQGVSRRKRRVAMCTVTDLLSADYPPRAGASASVAIANRGVQLAL